MNELQVAIIGVGLKFPKANNLDEFWENLVESKEGISSLSDTSALADEKENYVPYKGIIDDVDSFDATLFKHSLEEIELMNPQFRIVLEILWKAFEDSGYNPYEIKDRVGVYLSANQQFLWNLAHIKSNINIPRNIAEYFINPNHLATSISYKFGFTGPSIMIDTTCSSSLVAIDNAYKSLLLGDCDVALAGGVSITLPMNRGYHYEKNMIYSPDGKCRAFDSRSKGTVRGDGGGIVLLKPLDRAIQDNDNIYGVIRGTAVNNDGKRKVGYTAPSIKGQRDVILKALSFSGLNSNDISYIETHGTGTSIGDSVEMEALNYVFKDNDQLYLGALKNSIGHLDIAAGIAGFIKSILILKNKKIPPTINFSEFNTSFNHLENNFTINTNVVDLSNKRQIFTGVSSFGIGGTNCHVVLQNYQPINSQKPSSLSKYTSSNLFIMSAESRKSLRLFKEKFVMFLAKKTTLNLEDISHTLLSRKRFKFQTCIIANNMHELIDKIKESYDVYTTKEHLLYLDGSLILDSGTIMNFVENIEGFSDILNPYLRKIEGIEDVDSLIKLIKTRELTYKGQQLISIVIKSTFLKILLEQKLISEKIILKGIDCYSLILAAGLVNFELISNIILNNVLGEIKAKDFDLEPTLFIVESDENQFHDTKSIFEKLNLPIQVVPENAIETFENILNVNSYNDFLELIGSLWGKGYEIPWEKIVNSNAKPNKVSLTNYQFDKDRIWALGDVIDLMVQNDDYSLYNQVEKIEKDLSSNIDADIQGQIEEIWKSILNIDHVEANQNFFELGGDSMKAIMIVAKIEEIIGIEVNFKEIFENPTFGELLSNIKSGNNKL